MTSGRQFNPRRLDAARARRARTKSSLAADCRLSASQFRRVELGKLDPDTATVEHLAESLGFPPAFFYGEDLAAPPTRGAHFRAPASMSDRQNAQIQAATQLALLLYQWLDDRFTLPAVAVPEYSEAAPGDAAGAVRRDWSLGEYPIGEIVALLEAHGAVVFALPNDCMAVDAFSFWLDARPYIFLNTKKSTERTRMDVAHELGHLVLHTRDSAGNRDREREATAFAAAFLMPEQSVYAHTPRVTTLPQIIDAKRIWRVSAAALTVRLHDLGIITDMTYQSLFIQISRLGYRKQEPEPTFPELSQLLQQIMRILDHDGMSLADIAGELSLPNSDLTDFVLGLTPPFVSKSRGRAAAPNSVDAEHKDTLAGRIPTRDPVPLCANRSTPRRPRRDTRYPGSPPA